MNRCSILQKISGCLLVALLIPVSAYAKGIGEIVEAVFPPVVAPQLSEGETDDNSLGRKVCISLRTDTDSVGGSPRLMIREDGTVSECHGVNCGPIGYERGDVAPPDVNYVGGEEPSSTSNLVVVSEAMVPSSWGMGDCSAWAFRIGSGDTSSRQVQLGCMFNSQSGVLPIKFSIGVVQSNPLFHISPLTATLAKPARNCGW